MKTENLSTLKINKLTKAQYDRELAAGRLDSTALYLTPDTDVVPNGFATIVAGNDRVVSTAPEGQVVLKPEGMLSISGNDTTNEITMSVPTIDKKYITDLGIPDTATATESKSGLMSAEDKKKLNNTITNATNGSGDGAEVFNSSTNKATGIQSHAEGEKTTAAGIYSHSEGWRTMAVGEKSHAEGSSPCPFDSNECGDYDGRPISEYSAKEISDYWMGRDLDKKFNMAFGGWSHTECQGNLTCAARGHAEGWGCAARAVASHAEGVGTVTAQSTDVSRLACGQHVQGTYNAIDENNEYLHIVGCGTSESTRKNAHTLDRDGNAWFRGNVYIGGTKESEGYRLPKIHSGTSATPASSLGEVGDLYVVLV